MAHEYQRNEKENMIQCKLCHGILLKNIHLSSYCQPLDQMKGRMTRCDDTMKQQRKNHQLKSLYQKFNNSSSSSCSSTSSCSTSTTATTTAAVKRIPKPVLSPSKQSHNGLLASNSDFCSDDDDYVCWIDLPHVGRFDWMMDDV